MGGCGMNEPPIFHVWNEEFFQDIKERVHQSIELHISEIDLHDLINHRITIEKFYVRPTRNLVLRLNAMCRTGFYIHPLTWWDHFKLTYKSKWWFKWYVNLFPIQYDLKETIVRNNDQ
jgi:hypothetical protein